MLDIYNVFALRITRFCEKVTGRDPIVPAFESGMIVGYGSRIPKNSTTAAFDFEGFGFMRAPSLIQESALQFLQPSTAVKLPTKS